MSAIRVLVGVRIEARWSVISVSFLIVVEGLQALMNSVITIGLFTRFKVESNALVAVSHLQFVGDTLLIGRKCWANVWLWEKSLCCLKLCQV